MQNAKPETDKLYIVIPAYNEAENMEKLIEDWYPVVEQHAGNGESRLVIINDGSKDSTYEIMQEYSKTRPLFQPLTKKNGGHGSTVLFGYRYALENKADFVFQTDSDGQTDPAEFENFWQKRNEYDAIIGNRSARQDGASRKFVEGTLLLLLRTIFGVKIPDSNAPFRLMKRELLGKYIDRMPTDYNLPNVMLTTFFAYYHENIAFEEISFKPRQGGVNSINIRKITKIGFEALHHFYEFRRDMKKNP